MTRYPRTVNGGEARLASNLNTGAIRNMPWRKAGAVVHVATHETPPAPAWWDQETGDIHIDINRAKLEDANLDGDLDPYFRLDAKAAKRRPNVGYMRRVHGLVVHETAHSAWSTWMPKPGTPVKVVKVMTMLEELRIERRAMNHPARAGANTQDALRASTAMILSNVTPEALATPRQAAHTWALLRGRVNAGVIMPEEVEDVDIAARIVLGDDIVDLLIDLLDESLDLDADTDFGLTRFTEIAAEWDELITTEDEEGDGEGGCTIIVLPPEFGGEPESGTGDSRPSDSDDPAEDGEGSGDEGDGDGGGAGDDSDSGDDTDTGDADGGSGNTDDDGDDSTDDGDGDGDSGDEPDMGELGSSDGDDTESGTDSGIDPDAAELLAKVIAKTVEKITLTDTPIQLSNPREWASEVFGRKTPSRRMTRREPTVSERRAVSQLARVLDSMSIPTITKTSRNSLVPPGRLRGREAVRASAERSQGRMVTARPWEATKRRRTSAPPMTVGVMTDTSGSMRWAEDVVASLAYVFGTAGPRVGARTAAVTFGNKVDAVVWPGLIPTEVRTYPANGGEEAFDKAAAAMDGMLNLSSRDGSSKVLVIVSDGHFVIDKEPERAELWLQRWHRAGVHVVWVGARDEIYENRPGVVNIDATTDLTELITAMEKQLARKVGVA